MVDVKNLIKQLDHLYDYGEVECQDIPSYLIELDFIKCTGDKAVITRKWIDFSGKVNRDDLISSLVCYYPPLLDYLLWKLYHEAYAIGQSGDGKALYEFIDYIPKFADRILEIKDSQLQENNEIKTFYRPVFNGYPDYRTVLNKLNFMQLAVEIEDANVTEIGKTPNEIWVKERKISSNINLSPLKTKNLYTLTPYIYIDYEVKEDIREILSHPWETFAVVLGMLISEYKAEGLNALSLRPKDMKNPYMEQTIEIYIYDQKGKENKIGDFNDFIKSFCDNNHFYLFPNKAPDIHSIIFKLIDKRQFIYKDGEYILNQSFDERLYSSEGIIIKNRSRKFKIMIKDYIEELRRLL